MKAGVRLALFGLCSLALLGAAPDAKPCGAFVSRSVKTVPSLQVEQTLIVFDADKQLEHFIRQVAIRDPSPGFGFVVPVPEQPQVAKVGASPFEGLAREFPVSSGFAIRPGRAGGGLGVSRGGGAAPVTVLSQERVGSFTAFVLAATDPQALQKWLTDNQLVVAPEASAWFAHYVKLGFYFTALRYEQPAQGEKKGVTRAETLRISFPTPLPFYPYREPEHAAPAQKQPRELAVWLVSTRRYVPISLHRAGAEGVWKRPWRQHTSQLAPRAKVGALLEASLQALLPETPNQQLSVQVFEDQKTNRAGFGDVVMVPSDPKPSVSLSWDKAHKLMATLDPAYEDGS